MSKTKETTETQSDVAVTIKESIEELEPKAAPGLSGVNHNETLVRDKDEHEKV